MMMMKMMMSGAWGLDGVLKTYGQVACPGQGTESA